MPDILTIYKTESICREVPVFFYICDYLGITPKEFFDTETVNPAKSAELLEISKKLNNEKLDNLIALAKNLK